MLTTYTSALLPYKMSHDHGATAHVVTDFSCTREEGYAWGLYTGNKNSGVITKLCLSRSIGWLPGLPFPHRCKIHSPFPKAQKRLTPLHQPKVPNVLLSQPAPSPNFHHLNHLNMAKVDLLRADLGAASASAPGVWLLSMHAHSHGAKETAMRPSHHSQHTKVGQAR